MIFFRKISIPLIMPIFNIIIKSQHLPNETPAIITRRCRRKGSI